MGPALSYDILLHISEYLPDVSRLELSLMDKSTFDMMFNALLKMNFVDFISRRFETWPFLKNSAFMHAIKTYDAALLHKMLDSIGGGETEVDLMRLNNYVGDGSDCMNVWLKFLGYVVTVCLQLDNVDAVDILESRVPLFRRYLANHINGSDNDDNDDDDDEHGGEFLFDQAIQDGQTDFLRIILRAGYLKGKHHVRVNDWTEYSRHTSYGPVLRLLVGLGADPFSEQDNDGLNLLHRRSLFGGEDREVFEVAIENGMNVDSLTRGKHRVHGRFRYLHDDSTPLPEGSDALPTRCTALDLAAQSKSIRAMETLLSLGANPGGSLKHYLEEKARAEENYTPTWVATFPLHEIFEHGRGYNRPYVGVDWADNKEIKYIALRFDEEMDQEDFLPEWNRRACNAQECYGDESCGTEEHNRGALLENLAAYAEVILDVVRLLLQHGAGRYVNESVPDRETPLERFLGIAAEMRARHDFLATDPELGKDFVLHDGCPLLDIFSDGTRLLATLGEISDLLFDAGARVPFDGYEGGEEIAGVPRLEKLMTLHSASRNA